MAAKRHVPTRVGFACSRAAVSAAALRPSYRVPDR
jgi:hypothetical protein